MGAVLESDVNLRAPSHALRYLVIVFGAVALGGTIWSFNNWSRGRDQDKLRSFDSFRAAYAEKCGVPGYAGPVPDVVRDDFLTSPAIQSAVDKETAELSGGATCDEVVQALKKVDFALPIAKP
jgi:hypothetical protein